MIRFKVLGPLVVERDASTIALNAQMLRRLLATLLVNANRTVTVEALIAALWRDAAPGGSRKTVQVYVHRLRDALGEPELIIQEPGGYRLTISPDRLDAARFELLTARGRQLNRDGMARDAGNAFAEALQLWRGPAYADLQDQPPVSEEARRLDEERLRAHADYIETRLLLGHHDDLVPELSGLIEQHPYREDLRGHLMVALYRSGRQTEALHLFRKTRDLLRAELGLEPGPALCKLQESILRSDPELGLAPPEEDLAIVPRELPSGATGFTGRAGHLAMMDQILRRRSDTAVPIILISGAAGVGKTALAVRWAHRSAEDFPDGQLFIDLRGYSTSAPVRPIEALTAFLHSLGLPPRRIPIQATEAAALFRSTLAGRQMLIVLDNARSVDDVRALLPGTPGCMVVVTSRDRLAGLVARDGASRVPLDVLSSDEACALITRLHGEETAAPAAVTALAQLCAYLPLAIRIAVAHLLDRPDLTIESLIARVNADGRLGTLAVPGDDTMAVRKTFELSYRSVPADARLLFRRLGILPCHDFTPESAGLLADVSPEQASKSLELLADAHLLQRVRKGRYAVHDLLCEYAKERADAEDSVEARVAAAQRFYSRCLARAKTASLLLYPGICQLPGLADDKSAAFIDQQEALGWLDDEYINIAATIRRADPARHPSVAWHMTDTLRGYFDFRRHMAHWLVMCRAGLYAARMAQDDLAQAAMYQALGHAYGSAGKWDASLRNLKRAITFSRRGGWTKGLATAIHNVGVVYGLIGRPDLAVPVFNEALQLWREFGETSSRVKHMHNLATSHWQMGDLKEALTYSREAIARGADLSPPYIPAESSMGKILCMLGDYEAGIGRLTQAVSALRETGNRPFEAYTHVHIGEALLTLGRPDQARSSIAEGIRIGRDISLPDAVVAGLASMALVMLTLGDFDAADAGLDEAVLLGTRTRTHFELARALATLARCQVYRNESEAAERTTERAATLCRDGHFNLVYAETQLMMAAIQSSKGDAARAVSLAGESLEIFRRTGCRVGEAEAHGVLAALVPDRARAARHAEAAARIYERTGARPPRGLVGSNSRTVS